MILQIDNAIFFLKWLNAKTIFVNETFLCSSDAVRKYVQFCLPFLCIEVLKKKKRNLEDLHINSPLFGSVKAWSSNCNCLICFENQKHEIRLPLGWIKSKPSAFAQTAGFCHGIIMGSFRCVCHQISPPLQTRCSHRAILDSDGIQIRHSPFELFKRWKKRISLICGGDANVGGKKLQC